MTPSQLRASAERKRAEADALTASASRLRATADSFRDVLVGVPDRSRRVWQGPAASDFEGKAQAADRDLRRQAEVLTGAATGFENEAADLRVQAGAAEAQAAAEEAAILAGGPTLPPPVAW